MKKSFFFCALLLLTTLLCACAPASREERREHAAKLALPKPSEDVTDEGMLEIFRTDYGWDALEDQRLYWEGEQVRLDLYFSKDAANWQLKSALSYVRDKFIDHNISQLALYPYDAWLLSDARLLGITSAAGQVFVDGELIVQAKYEPLATAYYENLTILLPARTPPKEVLDVFADAFKGKKFTAFELIHDKALLIRFSSGKTLGAAACEAIKKTVGNLLPEGEKTGLGSNYAYVLVEFEDAAGVYQQRRIV